MSSLCIVARRCMSSCVIIIKRPRRISYLCALSPVASSTYIDIALRCALLRVVNVKSCHSVLSSSSDKADHCFQSKCPEEFAIGIGLLSSPMQSVNCEEIHCGRVQMTATYKVSSEQLITETMVEKLNNFHDWQCTLQLLSAHPSFTHTSTLSIRRFYLPFTRRHIRTSAYLHIRLLPIAIWSARCYLP